MGFDLGDAMFWCLSPKVWTIQQSKPTKLWIWVPHLPMPMSLSLSILCPDAKTIIFLLLIAFRNPTITNCIPTIITKTPPTTSPLHKTEEEEERKYRKKKNTHSEKFFQNALHVFWNLFHIEAFWKTLYVFLL